MAQSTRVPGTDQPTLRRTIGRTVLLLFVVGDILGAGIYALTGTVAAQVGGAIWLPFLLAFALATLTATAYAELVARYPKAAGAALYANRAFRRPFLTFLVAFAVMMSGITSASAAARAFGGDYLAELLPFGVPTLVAAWVFLGLITVVNVLGVSESVRVNVVLTLVEASGLLVIIGIGVWALAHGDGDPSRALDLHTDGPAWVGVLGGTALAFYALLGFEDSVNLAEEARHPRRDFPRALFGGLAVAGAIYLAVAFTASMLVETDVLVGSTGPLLEVVRVAGLAFPPWLFALIALLAVMNTALINMMAHPRGRDRVHGGPRADAHGDGRPRRPGRHHRPAPAARVRGGQRRRARPAPPPRGRRRDRHGGRRPRALVPRAHVGARRRGGRVAGAGVPADGPRGGGVPAGRRAAGDRCGAVRRQPVGDGRDGRDRGRGRHHRGHVNPSSAATSGSRSIQLGASWDTIRLSNSAAVIPGVRVTCIVSAASTATSSWPSSGTTDRNHAATSPHPGHRASHEKERRSRK